MDRSGFSTESVLILCFLYFPLSGFIKRKRIKKVLESIFEGLLFVVGITKIRTDNLDSLLLSVLLCMVYFPFMIWMTSNPGIRGIISIFRGKINDIFKLRTVKILPAILLNTFVEEIIWRLSFIHLMQQLHISNIIIVVSGSILFTLSHWHAGKKIIIREQTEFILFSLMLYTVYLLNESLIAVWFIHFVRNFLIKNEAAMSSV